MEIELEAAEAATGLTVDVGEPTDSERTEWTWSVVNDTGAPMAVDRVALRWRMTTEGRARMFLNGWQSWSVVGSGTVGVDEDPARRPVDSELLRRILPLYRDAMHADPEVPPKGELRSELVTALTDEAGTVCLGFDGGARHDGTFRARPDRLVAEAYLGGAVLAPGERRQLHAVRVEHTDHETGLARWADWAAKRSAARATAPYQVGWCTWYQYFYGIDEATVRDNLARASEWPFAVFQLDDGYQPAIGDWLTTNEKFPTPLGQLAADVVSAGYTPGIWIAPFLASPASQVAVQHPEWLAQHQSGRPLVGMVNPGWGGPTLALDTTRPEVLAHLEDLARTLVEMGWRYIKLDFTYAAALGGVWHDPSQTPAQRVRAGYDAIRRGAGDDTFLLGCGAPLGPCIGVVDGMRVGADVAPSWQPAPRMLDYYGSNGPAMINAWRGTLARSFMHRRLWLNDPDCLMLRTEDTELTAGQVEAWAAVVAASGGMVLVSDDLAKVGSHGRELLDRVLAIGREVDTRARSGSAPSCPDLLTTSNPTTLRAGDLVLHGDPLVGSATLS